MLHIAGRFHWLNLDFRRQVTALQTARQHFPALLPLLCAGAVAFSCVLQSETIFLVFFNYYFKSSHLNHVLQFLMSFFVWQLRILHHRAPLPEEASWTKELEAAERVVVRVNTVVGARSVCKLRSAWNNKQFIRPWIDYVYDNTACWWGPLSVLLCVYLKWMQKNLFLFFGRRTRNKSPALCHYASTTLFSMQNTTHVSP